MRRPLALIFAVLVLVSCTDVKTEHMTIGGDLSSPAAIFTPDPARWVTAAEEVRRWDSVVRWNDTAAWNAAMVTAAETSREEARRAVPTTAPRVPNTKPQLSATGSVADAIAQAFGANAAAATRVARCESGLNPAAVSAGGGNWGLFQVNTVHRGHFAEITGHPWSDVLDPYVNATFAAWLHGQEGWGPWTCGWAA